MTDQPARTDLGSTLPPFASAWVKRLDMDATPLKDWDNPEAISAFSPYRSHPVLISPPPIGITIVDALPASSPDLGAEFPALRNPIDRRSTAAPGAGRNKAVCRQCDFVLGRMEPGSQKPEYTPGVRVIIDLREQRVELRSGRKVRAA